MSNLQQNKQGILLISPDLERNVVANYCIDLAVTLKSFGWNVIVISAGGILIKELIRANIKHIQIPVNSNDFFQIYSNSRKIAKIISDTGINLIHANSISIALSCSYIKTRTNIKYISTVHSICDNWLFEKLFNKGLVKSEAIISPSVYAANYIVEHYKIDPNKINIVSRWLDNSSMYDSVSAERIINMANSLSVAEAKRIISVIGDYKKTRDIYLFIDAISQLNRNDVVAFIITNENTNISSLLNKIKLLDLEDCINIVDHNIDVGAIYSLSDVIVNLSSKFDIFNLEILKIEAMGRIVVSTDQGASPEIIEDGKTGKIIKSNSIIDMINGINWALNLTEDTRKNMSDNASKHAHFNFSQSTKIENTIDIYNKTLLS